MKKIIINQFTRDLNSVFHKIPIVLRINWIILQIYLKRRLRTLHVYCRFYMPCIWFHFYYKEIGDCFSDASKPCRADHHDNCKLLQSVLTWMILLILPLTHYLHTSFCCASFEFQSNIFTTIFILWPRWSCIVQETVGIGFSPSIKQSYGNSSSCLMKNDPEIIAFSGGAEKYFYIWEIF